MTSFCSLRSKWEDEYASSSAENWECIGAVIPEDAWSAVSLLMVCADNHGGAAGVLGGNRCSIGLDDCLVRITGIVVRKHHMQHIVTVVRRLLCKLKQSVTIKAVEIHVHEAHELIFQRLGFIEADICEERYHPGRLCYGPVYRHGEASLTDRIRMSLILFWDKV